MISSCRMHAAHPGADIQVVHGGEPRLQPAHVPRRLQRHRHGRRLRVRRLPLLQVSITVYTLGSKPRDSRYLRQQIAEVAS